MLSKIRIKIDTLRRVPQLNLKTTQKINRNFFSREYFKNFKTNNFKFSEEKTNYESLSLDKQFVNEGYSSKLVGYWLLLSAGMILGMICLGGYTRLTKSGLSMTRWKAFGYKMP